MRSSWPWPNKSRSSSGDLGGWFCFEANVIGNAQDPDELAHAHEKNRERSYGSPSRTDIPTRADVASAREAIEAASKKAQHFAELVRQMEAMHTMKDEDELPNWDVYTALKQDLGYEDKELDRLFKNVGDEDPLTAGKARAMLALKGDPTEGIEVMANSWRINRPTQTRKSGRVSETIRALPRRYKSAVERLSRSRVIPKDIELDKIQRYEAHLERGLHKALERLQTLQEARTAVPSTINLAVVQGGYREPGMASFGNSAIEAAGG